MPTNPPGRLHGEDPLTELLREINAVLVILHDVGGPVVDVVRNDPPEPPETKVDQQRREEEPEQASVPFALRFTGENRQGHGHEHWADHQPAPDVVAATGHEDEQPPDVHDHDEEPQDQDRSLRKRLRPPLGGGLSARDFGDRWRPHARSSEYTASMRSTVLRTSNSAAR